MVGEKLLLSQGQITVNPPDSAGISKYGYKKVVWENVVVFTSRPRVIAAHMRTYPSHQPKRMIPQHGFMRMFTSKHAVNPP